jgi:acetyltransferase
VNALAPRGDPFTTLDGQTLWLRPICPDDADALRRGFARLTPEQVRQRAFRRMAELSVEAAERLATVDPAIGAAYVVTDADGEVRAEARLYVDASHYGAEFALVVDPSLTGRGVGRALMQRLLAEAAARGLHVLWGDVLTDNAVMLDFVRQLGADRQAVPDDPGIVRVSFRLRESHTIPTQPSP